MVRWSSGVEGQRVTGANYFAEGEDPIIRSDDEVGDRKLESNRCF